MQNRAKANGDEHGEKVDVNQQVEFDAGKEARENIEAQEGENNAEELSSGSDEEYALPMRVRKSLSFATEQDMELRQVREIAAKLRDLPLFPADPADAEALRSWVDVDLCIRLPLAHCAFRQLYTLVFVAQHQPESSIPPYSQSS